MKPISLSNGAIEALKWLALLFMTGDHINHHLFNATLPVLFEAGRLCLPIFIFILAYNLARPGAMESGAYFRTMKRLAIFGALASVPFMALGGLMDGWWPLNVMFTLLLVTVALYLLEQGGALNLAGFAFVILVGGSSVEYWWPAILFGVAAWRYCKRPSIWMAFLAFLSIAAICVFINKNWWAFAAFPLIFIASRTNLSLPRLQRFFYAYYPLHLAFLWLLRIPMRSAGYLFF